MAYSQNGWVANRRDLVSSRQVPGTNVRLTVRDGAAGDVMIYVAQEFHRRVESISNARGALDDWGYAERPIRGGTSLSNHASGTAIDLNATEHPLGAVGTFTPAQVREIRRILEEVGDVVRWGGDYRNRKDEMHFEINEGRAAVERAAKNLPTSTEEEEMYVVKYGNDEKDSRVVRAMRIIHAAGETYDVNLLKNSLDENGEWDGFYGPDMASAVDFICEKAGILKEGDVGMHVLALDWCRYRLTQRYIGEAC